MSRRILEALSARGFTIASGLSDVELAALERRYDRPIPAEWRRLLAEGLPVGDDFFDWRQTSPRLDEAIAWPIEGLLDEIDEEVFWYDGWGRAPEGTAQRHERGAEALARVPKLWPLFGHRYLPCASADEGDPVFSIYQGDVIIYGVDLDDWLAVEFGIGQRSTACSPRRIPFWSELAGA